jgi:hypothetical protein
MKYALSKHHPIFVAVLAAAGLAGCQSPAPDMTKVLVPVSELPARPEMPDVMVMSDGTKVTTVEQWRRRREEMKQILEF